MHVHQYSVRHVHCMRMFTRHGMMQDRMRELTERIKKHSNVEEKQNEQLQSLKEQVLIACAIKLTCVQLVSAG